jgi:AcrR family transcriptional regulator
MGSLTLVVLLKLNLCQPLAQGKPFRQFGDDYFWAKVAVMTASQTRSRIITAARDLFNDEGYTAASAVDVANAIGISPGHLYYHFKGKGEIAAALGEAHVEELDLIGEGARRTLETSPATLEWAWVQTHIVMEELADCRFLWRESGLISTRDDELAAVLKKACRALDRFSETIVGALTKAGVLESGPDGSDGQIDQFAMALAFQLNWLELSGFTTEKPRALVERAAALAMIHLVRPTAA